MAASLFVDSGLACWGAPQERSAGLSKVPHRDPGPLVARSLALPSPSLLPLACPRSVPGVPGR
eukprot:9535994-Alexandrium_andersonii.AAC.1